MSAEDSAPRGTKRSKTATGTATAMDGESAADMRDGASSDDDTFPLGPCACLRL